MGELVARGDGMLLRRRGIGHSSVSVDDSGIGRRVAWVYWGRVLCLPN